MHYLYGLLTALSYAVHSFIILEGYAMLVTSTGSNLHLLGFNVENLFCNEVRAYFKHENPTKMCCPTWKTWNLKFGDEEPKLANIAFGLHRRQNPTKSNHESIWEPYRVSTFI